MSVARFSRSRVFAQAICWPLVAALSLQTPLAAAIITVGGTCTLPNAITAANTNTASGGCPAGGVGTDSIHLTGNVLLTVPDNDWLGPNGLPSVNSEIVVEGNGLRVERSVGAPDFRIFFVEDPGSLTLKNVTVAGGRIFDFGHVYSVRVRGGGILNFGTLALSNSTVSGNHIRAANDGQYHGLFINAIAQGGGIHNSGSLVMTNSTVSGNSAVAAIYPVYGLVGNAFVLGGGVANYGIFSVAGEAQITNSTISGNSVTATSGGAGRSSTVAMGGGLGVQQETTTLTHTTITGNFAFASDARGGGIYGDSRASTLLDGSIVAYNGPVNCDGVTDLGNNFASDSSCSGAGLITGLDSSLAENGGPTRTHALLPGSSAIDAAGACGLATDQRGVGRPAGSACDSGAFEWRLCSDRSLSGTTVTAPTLFEACGKVTLGPDLQVWYPGFLTVRSGTMVEARSGFTIWSDGVLTIEIDPNLLSVPP